MEPPKDPSEESQHAERLLAGGAWSGRQMDQMWERLRPRVVAPSRTRWSGLRALWVVGALASAGAGVLLLWTRPPDLTPRGGTRALVLVPSCGHEQACRAGAAVQLTLRAEQQGWVTVWLWEQEAWKAAGPPVEVPVGATTYPLAIVPEPSDVPELRLRGTFSRQRPDPSSAAPHGGEAFELRLRVDP